MYSHLICLIFFLLYFLYFFFRSIILQPSTPKTRTKSDQNMDIFYLFAKENGAPQGAA